MLTRSHIPTPALLLDLEAFEKNLASMADRVKQSGKRLRPHAKAHKCVEIAKRQIAAGACGVWVATVNEARADGRAGLPGLLLTSPVADPLKIAKIVETGAMVVVDHVQQVEWYAHAATRKIDVLVDLDVGDHRTGASSLEQALEIAQAVDRAKYLELRGIQGYSVSGSHAGPEDRKRVSEAAFEIAATAQEAFARAGLSTEILSGGSTGTWEVDLKLPEVTEFQAGSYAMMDLAYRRLGIDFLNAMTVLTTVVSANHDAFVTVDGGLKAFSTDRGYGPEALNLPGSAYRWGGDEFGYLDIAVRERKLRLGDRIEFIPPHCDPTVNLYDRIYVCRGESVEAVWSVMERMR